MMHGGECSALQQRVRHLRGQVADCRGRDHRVEVAQPTAGIGRGTQRAGSGPGRRRPATLIYHLATAKDNSLIKYDELDAT